MALRARDVLASHVAIPGQRIVDVGCGTGDLVRWLRERGANVVGVECGAVMRQRAIEADPEHVDTYLDAGGEDLPFDDSSFDTVVFMLSLHHVPAALRPSALEEAARVLRAGGSLFVVEPVPSGPGHEVFAPIDDESDVLAEAQVLLGDVANLGFELLDTAAFDADWRYADFAAFEDEVVGIDPDRAASMEEHREQVRAMFFDQAVRDDDGYALAQPLRYHYFTRSGDDSQGRVRQAS